MLSYFDPKVLEEFDFIVFGPFVGELFWEYAYWVPFLNWYSITHPNTRIEIWSRNSRKALYRSILDKEDYLFLSIEIPKLVLKDELIFGHQNGFKLGISSDKLENLNKYIEGLYFENAFIFKPPCVNRKEFFNPKHMDYGYTLDYNSYKKIMKLIYDNRGRIPIVICPTDKFSFMSEWRGVFEELIEANKYIIFIVGENINLRYTTGLDTKFVYRCSDLSSLDFNLNALFNCKFVIGDKNNSYFKIAKTVKYLTTYSIHDKSFNIKDFI